jgi:hypothetical protein
VEAWRDATHVRSYTAGEWRDWIEATGLVIDAWETVDRRYEYAEWVMRAGMDPAESPVLEQLILDASPHIREAFEIEVGPDGRLHSLLDAKFLMRAHKT